jgi:hypothetical protein
MSMIAKCYECAYRRELAGDCHSRCAFAWAKSGLAAPEGNPHGVKNGWWRFPWNFDPVWMVAPCPAFSAESDAAKLAEESPLADLLSILGGWL